MSNPTPTKNLALVDWSQLLEDYLDNIGVSIEYFCSEMSGGWMFGYIEALKTAGIKTTLFCVSARVKTPERFIHRATDTTICILPAPFIYRLLRRKILNPYAVTIEEAVGNVSGFRRQIWSLIKNLMPYFSTPVIHFWRELKRENCDTILCQDYEHSRFDVCILMGKFLKLPVFGTFQGNDESFSIVEKFFRRHALKQSTGLIAATETERLRLCGKYNLPVEKVAKIFNPLNLEDWLAEDKKIARQKLKIAENSRVAVWHGRIDFRRKGLDILLTVWQKVMRENADADWHLYLIGSGNNAEELRRELEKQKPKNLHWVDKYANQEQIKTYLSAADVFVFPSRREGFAVAPLEAMACSLPIVAFDIPCVRDFFEDEEHNEFIVEFENIDAFAIQLLRLLEDKILSRKTGEKMRLNVEKRFSNEAVGKQLREFLDGFGGTSIIKLTKLKNLL